MKIIEIKQNIHNPNLIGGYEKFKMSMYPNTEITMEPPMKNGKLCLKVDEKEKRRILNFIGSDDSWDSKVTIDKILDYIPAIPDFGLTLDLENDKDFLIYKIIQSCEALVAPNIQKAKSSMANYTFYFYEKDAEIGEKVKGLEKYATAVGVISSMKSKEPEKLIILAKYILNDFSIDNVLVAFDRMMALVNGEIIEKEPVTIFMDAAETEFEKIQVATDVKEAIHKNIIKKAGLTYINPISMVKYGSTPKDVVEFFMDEKNLEELGEGIKTDKPHTIRYQLKNFTKSKK